MENKKAHIIKGALELFAADGLAVSTAKVAERAGVANGTLFNYFPTKQDLIDELYLSIKTEMAELFLAGADKTKSLRDICFAMWNAYIRWAMANPKKNIVMHLFKTTKVVSPKAQGVVNDIFKPLNDMLVNGMERNEIINIGLDYLYPILSAQIDASIHLASVRNLKGMALESHINTGFEIYWRGIAPQAPQKR